MNQLQRISSLQSCFYKTVRSSRLGNRKEQIFTSQRVVGQGREQTRFISQQKSYFSTSQTDDIDNQSNTPVEPSSQHQSNLSDTDLDQIMQINPKLYEEIKDDPERLSALQELIADRSNVAEAADMQDAVTGKIAAKTMTGLQGGKVFSLPWLWQWGAPVFKATALSLIAIQAGCGVPWLSFIIMCGFGVRLCLTPMMIKQMVLINKMSHASPNIRVVTNLFKNTNLSLPKRVWYSARAIFDYAKQTDTSITQFFLYNMIQLPVFIIMVMSIRMICTENTDLAGAGILWFPNLNEMDQYLILPFIATCLNYFNLGRGITKANEHWYVNRVRGLFQVLQFIHLPFTHVWPSGAFVYWIASSSFVAMQISVTKHPSFLQWVNPHFLYNYKKMFGERAPNDYENYVDRLLNAEDVRLKQNTSKVFVEQELQEELYRMESFERTKKVIEQIEKAKASRKAKKEGTTPSNTTK